MANSSEAPVNEHLPSGEQRSPAGSTPVDGFVNEPLDVTGLPRLDEADFEPLDPNFLRVRLIGDAIFAAVVVIAAAVVALVAPWWIPLLAAVVLLALTGLVAWLQRLEVDHLGYLVRDKDFSYRSGVISRNVTTVPYARVQHVSIDRGPLARYFGMATLEMRTAGEGLTIPGMNHDTATRLKALVVDRAGVVADEELSEDPESAPVEHPAPIVDRAAPADHLGSAAGPIGPVDHRGSSDDRPGAPGPLPEPGGGEGR